MKRPKPLSPRDKLLWAIYPDEMLVEALTQFADKFVKEMGRVHKQGGNAAVKQWLKVGRSVVERQMKERKRKKVRGKRSPR